MFLKRANRNHPEFRIGASEMWPQAPGMAAWGLMTGVAMANSGMGLGAALLMTLTVFAIVIFRFPTVCCPTSVPGTIVLKSQRTQQNLLGTRGSRCS